MARKHFRAKTLAILYLSTLTIASVIFFRAKSSLPYNTPKDRSSLLKHVTNLINSGNGKVATEGQACRIPKLDVNSTEIVSMLKNAPKIKCVKSKDWVEVIGSTIKISYWVKKKYGNVVCSFTDIIRLSDYEQHAGMTTSSHTEYTMEASDVVKVHCASNSGFKWNKIIVGIRSDQDVFDRTGWDKVPKDSLELNVLMFGFDSLSHNMWKRKLPIVYNYVLNELKGIALNGYNIVGDGTPQALIPILTGKTELELPDTRKRMGKAAQFVNVYPFIWNDFQNNGYVTAWGEDLVHIGTFTYRLKGFQEQPVDHYMRTFYVEASPAFNVEAPFCYGGISRFQIMLDFLRNMFDVYRDRPKFAFLFHSEYSHDNNNWISNADEDLYKFIRELHGKQFLNNTLLILMSDHGSRFADIRNTQQGKQEERLPGFIFIFPHWFEKKYPQAIANFRINADRLSTPFDVHETLKNILHFKGSGKGNIAHRGISLFEEIPSMRTCQDAAVEPHWCTCLDWETVPVHYAPVVRAVDHLLNFINSYTSEHRDLCLELSVGEIHWGAKLVPNEHVLKFKKNADYDGFVGDMSANTKVSVEVYQVKVTLNPGNMLFEASIRHTLQDNKYSVSLSDISRINKYSHMTHCIEDSDMLHQLRKYCNCR